MASPITEGTSALQAFATAMKAGMSAVNATANATVMLVPGLNKLVAGLQPFVNYVSGVLSKIKQNAIDAFQAIANFPLVVRVTTALAPVITSFLTLSKALITASQASMQFVGSLANAARQMAEAGASLLSGPMRALDAGIGAIQSNVARFVSKIDPAAIFQFEFALDSLYATIGSVLVPVLAQFTQVIRSVASAIAGTTEQGREVIAAMAAGVAGLIAFGAAMELISAIATGGIGPVIGALAGAIGGALLASGKLQPIFDMLASSASGFLDQIGGALDVATSLFQGLMPVIGEVMGMIGGFASYLIDAFQQALPAIMALAETVLAVAKPLMMIASLMNAVLVEGLLALGKAFLFIAPVIVLVADVIGQAIKTIMGWVQQLLAMIGIELDLNFSTRGSGPKGATGQPLAPVRPAAYSTSMDDLRKAQAAAFSIGGAGAKKDPAIDTAKNTNTIAKQAEEMKNMLRELFKYLPEWITVALPNMVYERMKMLANDVGNWTGRAAANASTKEIVPGVNAGSVMSAGPNAPARFAAELLRKYF
jgi:hypothetical protein